MKKILIAIGFFGFMFSAYCQENNPYNQVGLDYVASVKLVMKDFNNGKVNDFSQESIEEYSKKLPSKVQVDMDMAGKIISIVKGKEFDLIKKVKESNLTETSKKILVELIEGMYSLSAEQGPEFLATKVDEIKNSDIPKDEKELILSFIAMAYQSYQHPEILGRGSCVFRDENGIEHNGTGACILLGIGIGYWVGNEACGVLCGVGGAIIGGILGAVS